ncbi:hypothetical protein SLE2022_286780 [Rubroshorea leprosula]
MNLSGTLSPALGRLSHLSILDFMWNNMSGSLPKEIGIIKTLELWLLSRNQLTGSLPDELGYLPNLQIFQIDENNISGPIPTSFANLNETNHFHMNNNSISEQIPPELSKLRNLIHFLLDNNNLSGYLPEELAQMPNLVVLSFGNIPTLLKLSLRNCKLQGSVPHLSEIPNLGYLELSSNQLSGPIPTNTLFENITTINLSNNNLTGSIPANFSSLPHLQQLLLANNSLNGSISSSLWQNRTLNALERLKLDLENNLLVNISGSSDLPPNVTLRLKGNPICSKESLVHFCKSQVENETRISIATNSTTTECKPQSCPYEYSPTSPSDCFCAEPLLIGFRLKSPSFSDFIPYKKMFEGNLTQGLNLFVYQLYISSFAWQEGPQLGMYLKLYPIYDNTTNNHLFNLSEVRRIKSMFTGVNIPLNGLFGCYQLINFILSDAYKDESSPSLSTSISKGALAGITLGTFVGAVTLTAIISLIIFRRRLKGYHAVSK